MDWGEALKDLKNIPKEYRRISRTTAEEYEPEFFDNLSDLDRTKPNKVSFAGMKVYCRGVNKEKDD